MGRALLMGGADVVDAVAILVQSVINVEYGPARIAEYRVYALLKQTLHHNLCSRQ